MLKIGKFHRILLTILNDICSESVALNHFVVITMPADGLAPNLGHVYMGPTPTGLNVMAQCEDGYCNSQYIA